MNTFTNTGGNKKGLLHYLPEEIKKNMGLYKLQWFAYSYKEMHVIYSEEDIISYSK